MISGICKYRLTDFCRTRRDHGLSITAFPQVSGMGADESACKPDYHRFGVVTGQLTADRPVCWGFAYGTDGVASHT